MVQDTPVIRIDPFFDGEGGPQTDDQLPGHAGGPPANMSGNVKGTTKAYASHTTGYHDINNQYTDNGRPMSAVMRGGGPAGIGGTIIPRSGMGGVPLGTQPHDTKNVQVNYDPHLEGQSAHIMLSEVTEAAIHNAEILADQAGIPPAMDINTMRMRGAAIMQGIESQSHMPVENQQLAPVSGVAVANIEAPNMTKVASGHANPQAKREIRPLAHFNQAPAPVAPIPEQEAGSPAAPQVRTVDLSQTPTGGVGNKAPSKWVTFEVEVFGALRVNYHNVLIENGFIVLVYDNTYTGGEMWVPPSGDETPPLAMHIDGDDTVYLVLTTGLQYSHGDNTYCILMIEQTGQLPE